ncbi:MAG: hypothetical protein KDI74_01030 [Gammaproteobacteria bacterium]|nr:hypothetical protein [Gammaproteobacteria bacterium]
MKQTFIGKMPPAMLLPLLLLTACSDEKAPVRVQQQPQAERLFDTQRSALEQAKAVAGSAAVRNERFQERAKDMD